MPPVRSKHPQCATFMRVGSYRRRTSGVSQRKVSARSQGRSSWVSHESSRCQQHPWPQIIPTQRLHQEAFVAFSCEITSLDAVQIRHHYGLSICRGEVKRAKLWRAWRAASTSYHEGISVMVLSMCQHFFISPPYPLDI